MSLAGRLAYHLYYGPLGWWRATRRHGGLGVRWQTARGRTAMRRVAKVIPPISADGSGFPVHFLTGLRFWEQTICCAYTLLRQSTTALSLHFHDDGSLDQTTTAILRRAFPGARIITRADTVAVLDASLPADRFPRIRARIANYPHLRKLTDIHVGRTGWRVVLDSDMLFFRRPEALLAWMKVPAGPLHLSEAPSAYGYDGALLENIAGLPIRPGVNVGITGLRSDKIDWPRLEGWLAVLEREAGHHYLQEQALVAMIVSSLGNSTNLPESDYQTPPQPLERENPKAVLHHYVDTAKHYYFTRAWRIALDRAATI